MTVVSQQLQHIQDGHTAFAAVPDAQHGEFIDQSTQPFLFPSISTVSVWSSGDVSLFGFVSLADVSSTHQEAVALGSQNAPHLWGTGGWTPSSAMDVLVGVTQAQGHPTVSHFASSDVVGDNDQVSEADQVEVEDQFNLSLAEFLHSWAYSSLRDEESRKRPRGPTLAEVERQRDIKNTEPLTRNDLQGERCDIQRINWTELGVSRLEARQARRQTYKNYTNLRFSLQWHVSTDR